MFRFWKRKNKPGNSAPDTQGDTVAMAPQEPSAADEIGEVAGRVWQLLASRGEVNLKRLAKQTGVSRDQAMQAVGWLAREHKIVIVRQRKAKMVSLASEEQSRAA